MCIVKKSKCRKLKEYIMAFYEPVLPILSDIVNFSFTYTIALFILALEKLRDDFSTYRIVAILVYMLALGFIIRSIQRVYNILNKLNYLQERIRYIIISFHYAASIFILFVTASIFSSIATSQTMKAQELINKISSELSLALATLPIILYLFSLIGIGLATLLGKGKQNYPNRPL